MQSCQSLLRLKNHTAAPAWSVSRSARERLQREQTGHGDAFFDVWACKDAALEQSVKKTGISRTICGICIAACPWTKKYREIIE
jgi:hypothetical protein